MVFCMMFVFMHAFLMLSAVLGLFRLASEEATFELPELIKSALLVGRRRGRQVVYVRGKEDGCELLGWN